jgi:hypothetical protein
VKELSKKELNDMGRKVVHASLFAGENKWGSQIEISFKTYRLAKIESIQ